LNKKYLSTNFTRDLEGENFDPNWSDQGEMLAAEALISGGTVLVWREES
jgi:hypothetical protein